MSRIGTKCDVCGSEMDFPSPGYQYHAISPNDSSVRIIVSVKAAHEELREADICDACVAVYLGRALESGQ